MCIYIVKDMLGATQQLAAIPTVLLTQNANNVCTIKPCVELTKGKKEKIPSIT